MEYLNAEQVADMLNFSTWFVYKNWQFFGGIKIGKVVRFEKQAVERILHDCRQISQQVAQRFEEVRRLGLK